MTSFEMIKYHGQEYPADVPLRIEEIAAHFEITSIGGRLEKSLHTEYSYGKRKLNSLLITNYPELAAAHKDGVPQLWKNEQWAAQFANFIIGLKGINPTPKVTTTTFLLNSNPASRSTYSCESHQQTPLGASFCFQRGWKKQRGCGILGDEMTCTFPQAATLTVRIGESCRAKPGWASPTNGRMACKDF